MADGTMTSPRTPPGDAERLAVIRASLAGRTQYEGRPEYGDEFLLRLIDERDATIADLRAQVAAQAAEIERLRKRRRITRWRHRTRRSSYDVLTSTATAQCSTGPINEGDHVTVYIGDNGEGDWWVRKTAEFQDGRFERIDDALAASPPAAQPKNAGVAPDSDEPSTSPALRAAPLTGEGSVVSNQRVEANAPPRPISQPVEAPQPGDVARARQLLTDELRGFGRKIGGVDIVATAVAGEFSRVRAAERSRILAMLEQPSDALVETLWRDQKLTAIGNRTFVRGTCIALAAALQAKTEGEG